MGKQDVQDIKDRIVIKMLDDVAFDGWSFELAQRAEQDTGLEAGTARAVFPGGLADILAHFADYADRLMLERLAATPMPERVRDRIRLAVMTRFEMLAPYREAVRLAAVFWARPFKQAQGGKILWRSADVIWNWAGDQAADYNRYTKRALLSGILGGAAVVWFGDRTPALEKTRDFVDRRVENVMQLGKFIARIKK